MPSPGTITDLHIPGGPGIRVDTHIYTGYKVPPHYDSMIGKLVAHGETREAAIARITTALSEMVVNGIKTNAPLHLEIMKDGAFIAGGANISLPGKEAGHLGPANTNPIGSVFPEKRPIKARGV